jgi:SAM-dependent methyltransferase
VRPNSVKEAVRARYARAATQDSGGSCGGGPERLGYDPVLLEQVPDYARSASLGCGSPVSAAGLRPGDVVVDLGSGAGLDVFLAARAVGDKGHVVGIDMTPEMIERAEANAHRLGLHNVSFALGEIESLPLPDALADVILSNCVINLSPDKTQVFREAHRVLRPGGRLVVSDILASAPLPRTIRENPEAWAACVAGAVTEDEYLQAIRDAGFTEVRITRGASDCCSATPESCCTTATVFSATVTAEKRDQSVAGGG